MKAIFLSLSLLVSLLLSAQANKDRYIELLGFEDAGRFTIYSVTYPDLNPDEAVGAVLKKRVVDTLINTKKIDSLINGADQNNLRQAINVINQLAKDGWVLVSTVYSPQPVYFGRARIHYYLKKSFE